MTAENYYLKKNILDVVEAILKILSRLNGYYQTIKANSSNSFIKCYVNLFSIYAPLLILEVFA